ncbi:MAG: PilT/PilU family type 4a pilus ATPase [Methylobacter sp.]|uniref:PilT/PilU family type 4a pilus ATPase n=1 Tax=Candidatus Methylobacter titanis TaxID=3053457 RepID=A0AA43Q6H4_9GAMM|nr:PilT/PilU family type 4a pilus ATPase [Candidatus Methylobacter titanis]MDI1294063.1 PilT/PilU family type 4a pilus ATPase [Candidatus Methylobacter titanis]
MTLTPYLKLMLEKKADSLSLKAGSPALLGLAGEAYPLGKNELNATIIKEIAFGLLNDAQKQELIQNKALNFSCAAPDGEKFTVSATVEDNGLVLLVVPDSGAEKVELDESEAGIYKGPDRRQKQVSYQILGAMPEDGCLNILPYLTEMAKLNASDLFLTVDSPVKAKIYGRAVALDDFLLTPELTQSGAFGIMTQEQQNEFLVTKDLDFAISLPDGSARFRANVFYQRRTVGLVMRLIPSVIPTGKDLGTPDILMELIMAKRGLLLVVGGTGSGKSTTLAAMINHRNANSAGHILTIEDPVEFSHPNLKSIVNQREVGVDTDSYARALKACLREAPDVIFIGEIRDRETMSAALELANTGHLCISTMHANNANQAMERVINMFPHEYHAQLFMDLAVNLNGVISQRLVFDMTGKRCAAIEVMINTPHIASLILKGELNEIKTAMTSSGSKGMRTFDDALFELYTSGKISLEQALKNADSSNDLEARINFG